MRHDLEKFKADYDWQSAFQEAVNGCYAYRDDADHSHPINRVTAVYAASPGENDGAEWIAVVGWSGKEGPFAVMRAGCDYTGWDCHAGGTMRYHDTLAEAVGPLGLTQEERGRLVDDLLALAAGEPSP